MINFREILKKHNLDSEENAEKIAEYVTKKSFNAENFAKEFNIPLEDAKVIIEVINHGIFVDICGCSSYKQTVEPVANESLKPD